MNTKHQTILLLITMAILVAAATAQNALSLKSEQENIAILKSDTALSEKARACEQLAIVGTAKSIPVLTALLDHEILTDYARLALEPIDDPAVDRALLAATARIEGKPLIGIITSIGNRRDNKAVGALIVLTAGADKSVAAAALTALGQIATPQAAAAVTKIMVDGPSDLRLPAAHAALIAAQRLCADDKRAAAKIYRAIQSADVSDNLGAAAVYGRILLADKDALPLLIEQLRAADPVMVETALRAARQLPGSHVAGALAAELGQLHPTVQVLTIKALLDRNDPAVGTAIEALALDKNPQVRAEALKALGAVGGASSVAVLLQAAAGRTDADHALASLRTISASGVDQAIISGMKASQGKLKADLIDILTVRRCTAAASDIQAELLNKDHSVALAALKALAELAPTESLPALVDSLPQIKAPALTTQAERTIAAVALRIDDESARADSVLAKLAATTDVDTRCSLLRVLGKIANGSALLTVRTALNDKDAQIRDTAVRALAASGNTRALGPLLEIFKTASDDTHRTLALRGFIRLLALDNSLSPQARLKMYAEAAARANTIAEKTLVLAGVSELRHPDALDLIAPWIYQPAIKHEVVFAMLKIAQLTAGAAPDRARRAALLIEREATASELKQQAHALAAAIDGFQDFIVAWQVTGPYTEANRDHNTLLWMSFEPEIPNSNVDWSVMRAGTNPEKPWMLDLLGLYAGDNRIAYARTCIHSDKTQDAILELGSDDGIKVWLNGTLVHNHSVARAAVPASDKVKITLKEGRNNLMLKVSQNVLTWEFCARLTTPDGRKIEQVRIDCLNE